MTPNEKSPAPSDGTQEMRYAVLPDRMPPIPPEQMTDAQKAVAAEIAAGPRGKVEGPYWPILRSPGFTRPVQKVGEYFRYHCPLNRRINEMTAMIMNVSRTPLLEDRPLPIAPIPLQLRSLVSNLLRA